MGFVAPMGVQEKVIPFLLEDTRDLVALAHTGTGKTAAFGIPIIQQIDTSSPKTQALILAPTRELCLQITDDLSNFSRHIDGLNIVPIYGGANILTQIRQVAAGAQIVVATPGRMLDMLKRKKVNVSAISWLVLDEADEMLDMGFKDDLNEILSGTPGEKRVLLFSATMPKGIESIAHSYMKKPAEITVGSRNTGAENISHQYYVAHAKDRYIALKRIADYYPDIYAIIFCRTKIETQEIADNLMKDGYNADSLHGDLSQAQRDSVMNRFRTRNLQMLVATDVAARGIDVTDLTHIINYNLPDDIEHYTHRSGRTGRAGKSGISIVIINLKEHFRIKHIEKQIGKKFEQVKIPTGPEVCNRQLLHLVEKLKNTEIKHKEIEEFLPAVYEKLKPLGKEDIIQRFISTEFNRFLSYYSRATDINVEMRKETSRPERKSSGSGSASGLVRLFINLGQMEKFNDSSLKAYLSKAANIPNLRISHIEVTRSCSFFEIDPGQVDILMARLKKEKYQNRRVQIEYAEKHKSRDSKESKRYVKPPMSFFARKKKRENRY
ncbi:MAG: DEAD/DEAH box helicase [Deltaproteobacteria bacterium HGW-Deltaproteobacteria-10]|nr:MAG: DEAD/DEAH box helicase [Deltaproteobacteria bacterium HGW-Deltaproteobacteria-10]